MPANHGGFETFAEYLSLYLVEKGWKVIVYCQGSIDSRPASTNWKGITLVNIPEKMSGALGTVIFDLQSIVHSLRFRSTVLTLGYNTAAFNIVYKLFGIPFLMNMDGIEWKRDKWSRGAKIWFWLNEKCGSWFANHLIADHPEIKTHLSKTAKAEKISTIAYGGKEVTSADVSVLYDYNLEKEQYGIVVARAEPENSILEIVEGFSREQRNKKLVVLGNFQFESNAYHKAVRERASDEVVFLGAIYDKSILDALRFYCLFYVHGHTVGGTNPSLVEAIGSGNAIIAHNNKYNRWVAKDGAIYFSSTKEISECINRVCIDSELRKMLKANTNKNFEENFRWQSILNQYEGILEQYQTCI